MSSGLLALLDDVASIAKVAATSVDDIASMSVKAGAKSAGVLIDDTAVTPRYVIGFKASRELPIIWRIAKGSLFNKLVLLLPGALILSLVAPGAITPILMLGGLFLSFEGAEKVLEWFGFHHHEESGSEEEAGTPKELEDQRVASAIKTDLILSAEIMALTLSALPSEIFWEQAAALALVGVVITFGVYGAVALIVKADDVGLALAKREGRLSRVIGRGLVRGMPRVLEILSTVGTIAMLMVGGGIILHGTEVLGFGGFAHMLHDLAVAVAHAIPFAQGVLEWIVQSLLQMLFGFVVGLILIPIVSRVIGPVFASFFRKSPAGD